MPPRLRLRTSAATIVLPMRYDTGMPITTRGLTRRLNVSGNRCGAIDGRMCSTAMYSLRYPATPSDASSRTSSTLATLPLNTRIGSLPFVELADALDQVDTRRVRHPQIEDDQIEIVEVGAHVRQQLGDGLDHHGAMARGVERRLEAITHERCVGGDEHGLPCRQMQVITRA